MQPYLQVQYTCLLYTSYCEKNVTLLEFDLL